MNRENFSPMQNFAAELIERVGCISLYQLEFIMYKLFNAKPSVVQYMVYDFGAKRICHTQEDNNIIIAGRIGNEFYKMNKNTIYSIAVALQIIKSPLDYRTISRPYYGEDLRFMADDVAYGVFLNREDNITKPLFYEKQYIDQAKKLQDNGFSDNKIKEAIPKMLIVYPLKADVKTALKNIESLNLTMPHGICFTQGKDIHGKIDVKVLETE